jgi:FAD/FMN-containing dehydrogenase
LYPLPAARCTAWAALASLPSAVALLHLARRRLGDGLTGFEVMGRHALQLVRSHFPELPQPLPLSDWTVLLELSDAQDASHAQGLFEALLVQAIETGVVGDAAVAASLEHTRSMWQLRESIPLAQAAQGPNIKHDIALPVSAIADFVHDTDAALRRACPGVELINFGHLGDGNLHYNVQAPQGTNAAEFVAEWEPRINAIVYDAVARRGGSISAEHGIGTLKRNELARRKSPVALQMMHAIKRALDPLGLMNPGRVL